MAAHNKKYMQLGFSADNKICNPQQWYRGLDRKVISIPQLHIVLTVGENFIHGR